MVKAKVNKKADALPDGLARPAIRALDSAAISRLSQCARLNEKTLRGLHGMGPKAIGLIRGALEAREMTFAK